MHSAPEDKPPKPCVIGFQENLADQACRAVADLLLEIDINFDYKVLQE